jgi:chromosome segregation ATPase
MGINKMADTKTGTFKISKEEKSPDSLYGEEVLALRIEKVNQKLTLFSILISCIVGAIILIAYLDLRNRVAEIDNSKQSEVQVLTEDLEKRLESIKNEYAKLEATIDKKISYIDKNTYLIKENLAKSDKTLKTLKSSKVDKKEQEALISRIDNKIVPIQKGMNDVSAKIDALEKALNTKIDTLSKSVDKSNSDITGLSTNKIDKDTLDIKLLNEKKYYQQQINQIQKDLQSKINSLQNKINALENVSNPKTDAATPAPKDISENTIDEEPE